MKEGSKVDFKLEDGSIINFKSNKPIEPISQAYQAGVYTYYTFDLLLTQEELKKLASFKVTAMRKPGMPGGYENLDVKKKGSRVYWSSITKGAKCIEKGL